MNPHSMVLLWRLALHGAVSSLTLSWLQYMQYHCSVLFMQAHYATILRLKQYFPFSLIDAMGGLEDTRAQISRELRYQSSLDLDEATYAAIRHLPLAQDLVRASRQQLVHRLDTYSKRHHKIFMEVGCACMHACLLLYLTLHLNTAAYHIMCIHLCCCGARHYVLKVNFAAWWSMS